MRINGQSLSKRVIDLLLGCLSLNIMSLASARSDIQLLIMKEVQLPLLQWCLYSSSSAIRDAITELEALIEERKAS